MGITCKGTQHLNFSYWRKTMYVSIDLSANLRLDAVVLQYITRVFLDKVNLLLSSYKNTLFSWQFSGGNKRAIATAKLCHGHAQTGPSREGKLQRELQLAREPQAGCQAHPQRHGHGAGCHGPQRGGHPPQPLALPRHSPCLLLPGSHRWERSPYLKLLPDLSIMVVM